MFWGPADTTFGKLYVHQQRGKVDKIELKRIIKAPYNRTDILTMLNLISFDFYVKTLSKCAQNVFVDTLSYVKKLRTEMLSRHVDVNQISQSEVAYGTMYQNWVIKDFEAVAETYSARRFGLVQSGLIRLWNEWKHRLESWNDTLETARQVSLSFKPISIMDKISVVLYVDLSVSA